MDSAENAGLSEIMEILNNLDGSGVAPEQQMADTTTPPVSMSLLQAQSPQAISNATSPLHNHQQPEQLDDVSSSKIAKPYIKIVEQPASKALRFRYKCEGRSAGSIPGAYSTPENKTYPTIEIVGFKGEAVIVVSCVTKEAPYRPHPHNIVGKEGCKDGICSITLKGEPLRAVFSNLGIQCVKKNEIKAALALRESMKVIPFKIKPNTNDQPSSFDLNAVRLCFQAFIKTANGYKPLKPVVSDPIYDKKAMSDLVICRLCSCSAKVDGGDELILLCEKVLKDDVRIRFFELNDMGEQIWEDFAEFQPTDIHRQTAIAFKTPRYRTTDIKDTAKVFIQLIRPSDGAASEPLSFEYYPNPDQYKRKCRSRASGAMDILRKQLTGTPNITANVTGGNNFLNTNFLQPIKVEESLSPHPNFDTRRSPYMMTPSPQPLSPLNRLDTPSPGLAKSISGGSQSQMCEMYAFHTSQQELQRHSPAIFQQQPQSHQPQQQHFMVNNSTNPFLQVPGHTPNNMHNVTQLPNNCDATTNNSLNSSNMQMLTNNQVNPFMNHMDIAPKTSGGSITPLWPTQNTYNNQGMHNPHESMGVKSFVQMEQDSQLQQDLNMLINNVTSTTQEGGTLNDLAMVDSDLLMNITNSDLILSGLSISG